jgi:hypothetical protein
MYVMCGSTTVLSEASTSYVGTSGSAVGITCGQTSGTSTLLIVTKDSVISSSYIFISLILLRETLLLQ